MNVFLLHNDEVLYKGHTINQGSLNIIVVYVALPTTKENGFVFSVRWRRYLFGDSAGAVDELSFSETVWGCDLQGSSLLDQRDTTVAQILHPGLDLETNLKRKSHRWLNKKEKIFKKVISVRPQPGPHTSSGSAVWAASRLWTANWP